MSDRSSDNMGDKWYTIAEAEAILGVSKRTIQRRIKLGEIESKLENEIRLVKLDISSDRTGDKESDTTLQLLERENQELRQQLEYFRKQLDGLHEDLRQERTKSEEARERSDTIIMQLTRQLEQSQKLLEDKRPKRWRLAFWRRRVFGREEE